MGYKIADGSGLSLYNYVSADLEVKFLRYAYQNSNIYLHLYPSLRWQGQDGTLKKRMQGQFTNGNVHAKTGTVTGINSLAGLLYCHNGRNLFQHYQSGVAIWQRTDVLSRIKCVRYCTNHNLKTVVLWMMETIRIFVERIVGYAVYMVRWYPYHAIYCSSS